MPDANWRNTAIATRLIAAGIVLISSLASSAMFEIVSMPPPSSGGIAVLQMLGILFFAAFKYAEAQKEWAAQFATDHLGFIVSGGLVGAVYLRGAGATAVDVSAVEGGRKRRLGIEDEYWDLILAGVGTVEACKLVGIGRKTGYRWRAELGGLPPRRRVEGQRSDRYLSLIERQRIATLRRQGLSIREIARRLERSPSTISRELRRNTAEHDIGGYDADLAHSRARERLERPRGVRLATEPGLRAAIQSKLNLEWSPEQIAAWLRTEHPDMPRWHLCHESLYKAIYNGGRSGLSRQLTTKLRTGRPLRKRRRRAHERTPRFIAPALLIDHRPAVVEELVGREQADRFKHGDVSKRSQNIEGSEKHIHLLVATNGEFFDFL